MGAFVNQSSSNGIGKDHRIRWHSDRARDIPQTGAPNAAHCASLFNNPSEITAHLNALDAGYFL
jgi:hypothetical protein